MTYCPAASLYASLGHEAAKKNGLHCAPVNCAGPALGEMKNTLLAMASGATASTMFENTMPVMKSTLSRRR